MTVFRCSIHNCSTKHEESQANSVSSEHWQRMEKLYHAALEREPGERDAFLEEACNGDEDLRRKLTLLLAEKTSNVKILDSPAWEAISSPTEAAAKTMLVEGTHLGAYVIE